jgi:hypothetical protein
MLEVGHQQQKTETAPSRGKHWFQGDLIERLQLLQVKKIDFLFVSDETEVPISMPRRASYLLTCPSMLEVGHQPKYSVTVPSRGNLWFHRNRNNPIQRLQVQERLLGYV